MRVIAAMSGGVDSAVAAARAVAAGHEVIGVHLALSQDPQAVRESSRGCCSLEDSADARRVCDRLGIPFYVWDFSERFREEVIEDFITSYEQGQTPNPCLRCNEKIKFSALLDRARALGFDAVATGHYANLGADGILRRGADPEKDQSYVLGVLSAADLAYCLFPVGNTPKPEIRAEAAKYGFSVATKPDSYDICFIPDGQTATFLGRSIGLRPGLIVDETGRELKQHSGSYQYTIGQRKGLDIKTPAADGQPRYVTKIDATSGTVTVGPRSHLAVSRLVCDRIKVLYPAGFDAAAAGTAPGISVQIRAHGQALPARISADLAADRLIIDLADPHEGVAPGQAAVIYQADPAGDMVLGSGTIIETFAPHELVDSASPAESRGN